VVRHAHEPISPYGRSSRAAAGGSRATRFADGDVG